MTSELLAGNGSIDDSRHLSGTSGTVDFESEIAAIPARLCSLPPLSAIATRVLTLSDDPDADLKQLSTVVEGDPAFAAEVLFLANSPLFGFPSKLQELHHAVAILGLDRIKSLAMTVAMRAFVGSGDALIPPCWRHSVACAVIAETLSQAFGIPADQAYSAALMHDIGRLGLIKAYPKQMQSVLETEYQDSREALAAERAAVQVDHKSAGAWLVGNWSLPQPFHQVCRHHHDPVQTHDPALLKLVKVSCLMSDTLGYSAVLCRSTPAYPQLAALVPPGVRRTVVPDEGEMRGQVEARLSSLDQ